MKRNTVRGFAFFVWCFAFGHAVQASTLADFMGSYDPDLKFWALTFALLGGSIKSIMSWQGDTRAVRVVAGEFAWNLFHASVAGMAAFMLIQGLRGSGYAIASEVRVGCILLAGWHGKSALTWMVDFIKDRLTAHAVKHDAKPLDPKE